MWACSTVRTVTVLAKAQRVRPAAQSQTPQVQRAGANTWLALDTAELTALILILATIVVGLFLGGLWQPMEQKWSMVGPFLLLPLAVPLLTARRVWLSGGTVALVLLLLGHLTALPNRASLSMWLQGFMLMLAAGSVYCVGYRLATRDPERVARWLLDTLAAVSALTVLLGILGWLGWLPIEYNPSNQRFAPFLNYENTYAALAALGALAAMAPERGQWQPYRWPLLVLCSMGVLLNDSLGALLVWGVALAGYVVVQWRQLAPRLPQHAVLIAAAAAAARWLRPAMHAGNPADGRTWAMVLGSLALAGLVAYAFRWQEPWWGRQQRLMAVAASLLAVGGAVALRGELAAVLKVLISPTSLGVRAQSFLDGFLVFRTFPLGLGTDGWRAVYQTFQSWGYVVNFAHSGLLETAISTGIFGLLGMAVLGVAGIWRYGRLWLSDRLSPAGHAVAWVLAALAAHALVDVDLMMAVLVYLLWFAAGYLFGAHEDPVRGRARLQPLQLTAAGVGVVLALAAISGAYAEVLLKRGIAAAGKQQWQETVSAFRGAAALDPTSAAARANLATTLGALGQEQRNREEADRLWQRVLELEPYRFTWWELYGNSLTNMGRYDEAVTAYTEMVRRAPWVQFTWERLITRQVNFAKVYLEDAEQAKAKETADGARHNLSVLEQHAATEVDHPGKKLDPMSETLQAARQQLLALP